MSEEAGALKRIENIEIIIESSGNRSNLDGIKEIPNTAALDHATTAAKIVAGALPIVGSAISEILGKTTSIIVSARETRWKEAVVKGFEEMFEKLEDIPSPEELFNDDKFVSALLNATQIASRNHQQEKLDLLRNAVLNSGLPDAPEYNLQSIF